MSHVAEERRQEIALQDSVLHMQWKFGAVLKECDEHEYCKGWAPAWRDTCDDCEDELRQEAEAQDWYERRDEIHFADPGGSSALRAEVGGRDGHCPRCQVHTRLSWDHCAKCGQQLNPRNRPCPSCGAKNVLTPEDVSCGYQCDRCAERAEGTYVGWDY